MENILVLLLLLLIPQIMAESSGNRTPFLIFNSLPERKKTAIK